MRIVVIGGGTGTATLLNGLKEFADLTALVSMADDGGSTGRLRNELGVSAAGDIRQCLAALSDIKNLKDLFAYRFDAGALDGHSFGNLFLAAAERSSGSFEKAIKLASEVLAVKGRVLPVTADNVQLVLNQGGNTITGVYEIANTQLNGRPALSLRPAAALLPEAGKAIQEADLVLIAPGNLYGSIAPVLLTGGLRQALESTRAQVVYVCNMVNRSQTDGFKVHDYAEEIERFIGAPVLDQVLYNNALLESGVRENESPVTFDEEALSAAHYQAKGLPLADSSPTETDPNDKITHMRSLVRHDARAVAEALNLKAIDG